MKAMPADQLTEITYTPVEQALELLRERRKDRDLIALIEAEMGGDIPPYLLERDCFVLPRHIATPNNEALYVLEQAARYGATAIFSQDLSDIFTSVNNLKRRLARPERCLEADGQRSYCKVDLVDVQKAEKLPLREVRTHDGRSLSAVHNGLFDAIDSGSFRIVDDAAWIDRNHRGELTCHYRKYLLLFISHGILFEEFDNPSDDQFKNGILRPILTHMIAQIGLSPIIVRTHAGNDEECERFGLSHRREFSAALCGT